MEPRPSSYRTFLSGLRRLVIAGLRFLFWSVLITWSALAIHYSNLPWAGLRTAFAAAFAAFAVGALWLSGRRHMTAIVIGLFGVVMAWWIATPPSHDRLWRPEVAVMPRAFVDGDRVRLTGVRNFDTAAVTISR